jgi:hypothetical protein
VSRILKTRAHPHPSIATGGSIAAYRLQPPSHIQIERVWSIHDELSKALQGGAAAD